MKTYRMGGGNGATSRTAGTNHPGGVLVNYYLKDTAKTDTIRLAFKEMDGDVIKVFSNYPDKENDESVLNTVPGINQINWNMRYKGATTFPGMILWWATTNGPTAVPGEYTVSMSVNGVEQNRTFELVKDPRSSSSQEDLQEQFDFMIAVRDKLSEANQAVIDIRKVRAQINDVVKKAGEENEEVTKMGKEILEDMKTIEEALYQTKNESRQDPLNFPIRLNNKVGHLASLTSIGDYKPTDQAQAFFTEVSADIDAQIADLELILGDRIDAFNKAVYDSKIDAVKLEE
jgi:hypothetical protein